MIIGHLRNLNQNTNISIDENELENVVCNISAILFKPQCVNPYLDGDGLVQDCINSIANALELLQSYIKPSIF